MTVNTTRTSQYHIPKRAAAVWNRSSAAQQTVLRQVVYPTWLILALVIVFFLLPIQVPFLIQLIPLMLSVLLFGLPHGAADLAVPDLLLRRKIGSRRKMQLFVGYLMAFLAVLVLWWLTPGAGFIFFILMTWWHWGTADLYAVKAFHGVAFLDGRFLHLLTALVRGAIPMVIPLIFFPEAYQLAANTIGTLFGANLAVALAPFFTPQSRFGTALVFATLVTALLALSFWHARLANEQRAWFLFAGETGLLALFFAVVPSFAAIGIYFCLWHSAQHIARLALLDKQSTVLLAQGSLLPALVRFARQAALPTLVALLALFALFFLVPRAPSDVISLVGLYLAVIAALTLPHAILVAWMDRRQFLWPGARKNVRHNLIEASG